MNTIFLLGMPGGGELIVIAVIILLLFGGKKIPELMKGLGKGIREFNSAKANIKEELEEGMKPEAQKKEEKVEKPEKEEA